tara:strand:- start:29207 stop:29761 length:555 start_codon:yes stop_codon:yes gene_type:complete
MLMVFKRVAGWNAKRYDQEYNHELTIKLLKEELSEYVEAGTPVDELDAFCDLTYLAMGGLWKMGVELDALKAVRALKAVEATLHNGVILHPMSILSVVLLESHLDAEAAMYKVIGVTQLMMLSMGFNQSQCEGAMHIVCDANDTKPAKKTASDVKANVDKGSSFVAPEPRLQKLIDSIIPEVTH